MLLYNQSGEKICCFTLLLTFLTGQVVAQDPNPVCPPPAPICRSYETSSCEWALNMIPVYVCRTDLLSILGLGQGYQQRPQTQMIYQQPITTYSQQPTITYTQQSAIPFNQQTSYVPTQSMAMYKSYPNRQPSQYRQAVQPQFVGRDVEQSSQGSSQSAQVETVSQPAIFVTRAIVQGATREASSSSGQKSPGTSNYQAVAQPVTAPQSSYSGSQSMNNEGAE